MSQLTQEHLNSSFATIAGLIGLHAKEAPERRAIVQEDEALSYAQLDRLMDRVAAGLQRDGIKAGDVIAICAATSIAYAVVYLGALRAGVVVAPLSPGATAVSLAGMLEDAGAKLLFTDQATSALLRDGAAGIGWISLDGSEAGQAWTEWLAEDGVETERISIEPDWPFNIIYSSGTTGEPKGIVQPHGMRWAHVRRGAAYGYGEDTVTLLSTPLYSNTTLVVFFPTLAYGGTVVLMAKFDAVQYLRIAQKERVTHTMLVPVQYQRLMALPDFDGFDLKSFRFKFSTSAPFSASLKADVLKRWPGGLVEFYGMTEGGGTCILEAHLHPEKLHTVGRPAGGHDIRLIDETGCEVSTGEAGEVVGHSPGMMRGYHKRPAKTREVEWFDAQGKRFIRTGDVGRFDEQGFLSLLDRRKDLIISGGFNIYPSDLEAVLTSHPGVQEAAVIGAPSEQWGETPVAFVVCRKSTHDSEQELRDWVNGQVGKTQRLGALHFVDELPRSPIGKVLKRELKERYICMLQKEKPV